MGRSLRLLVCAAVAAALTLPGVSTASGATHAKKADLVLAVVTAPGSVEAGAAARVRVKVRNAGKGAAPASVVRIALSTDGRAGGDRTLKPTLAVPSIPPGKSWSGRVSAVVPAATPVGSYHLIACADATHRVREANEGNNCRASGALSVVAPPTSHDLIDADVAAGVLTEEQGLVYKVFSDFDDPRLPAKYAGVPDAVTEGALEQAAESWNDLSPDTQDQLRPFLVPAFYPGSHWTPPASGRTGTAGPDRRGVALDAPWCSGSSDVQPAFETWDHLDVTSASGDVRIWWLKKNAGDSALATRLGNALQSKILPALATLMGRTFQSDGGGLCDGGSDALDIALVDAATATTYPDGSCGASGTSAHMVFPRTKPPAWADIEPYLAHEVMHAIQFAMPVASSCSASSWLREMTAEWVQDYVTDPSYGIGLLPDDTEHLAAPLYLDRPNTSLDAATPALHDYGSYLFSFFAARKTSPDVVRTMWTDAATMNPTAAVDAAVGGFDTVWPEFALDNWNRTPETDDYQSWDQLTLGAKPVGPEPIKVGVRNPTVDVKHLAAQYLSLAIDKDVSELEITNDLAGQQNASLQAVIEYSDGSTKVVSLSGQQKTTLCIDDGSKRATAVVLVFGNADQTGDLHFAPTIEGKASCGCSSSTTKSAPRAGATCTGNITFSWSEETTDEKPEGIAGRTTETGGGTLGLAFDSPTPSDPATYWVDPASTYEIHRTWHSESYRDCGTETGDVSDAGSGTFDTEQTFAAHDPDANGSEEVGVSLLFVLPVTATKHFASECTGQSSDQVIADHWGVPGCPPKTGGNYWWKFQPVSPGSETYRIDCTGTVKWEDGLGKHVLTSTVTGTITLP